MHSRLATLLTVREDGHMLQSPAPSKGIYRSPVIIYSSIAKLS